MRSVGVFDSGIGGLSVAREIRGALPHEDLLYLCDTAYLPYGDRTTEEVRARTLAAGRWLEANGAKVMVVACNTASGAALETLREHLAIPVIGLEPAVKPAVAASRNGRVGVMATVGTLRSERYARLVERYANGSRVLAQPCPGLADLVEDGHLDDDALWARMPEYTAPLKAAGVDTVVLGCTHYVFVRDAIARALGPEVALVDSGPAIARQTRRILEERGALAAEGEGSLRVLTTGDADEVGAVAARIWGAPLPTEHLELRHVAPASSSSDTPARAALGDC
ncbi:MAG TPA: glutamate racemase [Longimicrobium sp.]|nr:glutamate racemase [Longimicrobium sp.]